MTDPRVMAELAALRAKVVELEARVPAVRNQAYQSFGGVTELRSVQMGFPAETTGVYNATTGYPWKRLMLNTATPAFQNAGPLQEVGKYAFEVGGDTSIASGSKIWLEYSPEADGYVLYGGTGGGTGTTGFFARLTTQDGSTPFGWKWVKRIVDGSGAWVDDGGTSADFNAFPTEQDGTDTAWAEAGQRVWMIVGDTANTYEFFPVPLDADPTSPGLINLDTQDFGGIKGFNYNLAEKATGATTPIFKVYTDYQDTLVTGLGVDQIGHATASNRKSRANVYGQCYVQGNGYAYSDALFAVDCDKAGRMREAIEVHNPAGASFSSQMAATVNELTGTGGWGNNIDFEIVGGGGLVQIGMLEYPDSTSLSGYSVSFAVAGYSGDWLVYYSERLGFTDGVADPVWGQTGSFGLGAAARGGLVTTLGANIGAGTNGNIIVRSGGAWTVLAPPGADGTYALRLVVGGTGTTFTFSWV